MAYTTIDKPEDYFNTKLYTGTGSTQSITGVGFQADMIWNKNRSSSGYHHHIIDSVRGVSKLLRVSSNIAEFTSADSITSLDSDGFTIGADANSYVNANTDNQVTWSWKAGGTASSNTDGDITSSVSVNTTAGFSIGTYTGSGTDGDTVGTGLTGLSVVIAKCRNASGGWVVKHQSLSGDNNVYFQVTNAAGSAASAGAGGIGALNDSTFPLVTGTSGASSSQVNASGNTHVFYAFAEKKGYSKFGSYVASGDATDANFIYLGFKPSWVMFKKTSGADNWLILDNKRSSSSGKNLVDFHLRANLSNAESDLSGTDNGVDFLSNGIKLRKNNGEFNASGGTYIYMAFAENPFVTSTGIPTTAR